MNTDIFTIEQENILCMYDTSSRAALTNDIRAAMPDFDDPEICDIAGNAIKKLAAMSDAEFSALTFSPAYYSDETEV